MAKAIYKFYSDCGRMGELSGVFVAEEKKVEAAMDKTFYLSDVLGKHSEFTGTLNDDDVELTKVTTDKEFIKLFEKYKLESGINPLDYIDED